MRAAPIRPASSRSGSAAPSLPARSSSAVSIDCFSRAAALPVGAASAMRSAVASGACANSSAKSRATVYVLPVPGPPVITARSLRSATAQAIFCQSVPPSRAAWSNSLSSQRRTPSASTGWPTAARARTDAATVASSRQ